MCITCYEKRKKKSMLTLTIKQLFYFSHTRKITKQNLAVQSMFFMCKSHKFVVISMARKHKGNVNMNSSKNNFKIIL